jgi:phosphate transport system ATP-binding protein
VKLLIEEPCSVLDSAATVRIETLIRDLKEKYIVIILIYDLQQAARISDYTAFMYGGQMVEYGATDEIFKHPKNELTEKYIIGKF